MEVPDEHAASERRHEERFSKVQNMSEGEPEAKQGSQGFREDHAERRLLLHW